ncbi:NADH-ubiquinone oxidoreductase chain 1 [Gaertneriomyces sp. JEL0708]|nr:NADH-ubiquinone oxidoreductase chain 1 [Gaertneriomyces sp. JEL0708]
MDTRTDVLCIQVSSSDIPSTPTRTASPSDSNNNNTPNNSSKRKDVCTVTVRIRPQSSSERLLNPQNIWDVAEGDNRISLDPDYASQQRRSLAPFHFDSVQTGSDNKKLYELACRNVVRAAMDGINATVFAYGQTASGKTYSMMGVDEQPGVIPQAVDDIFSYIRSQSADREYLLRVSYMEIYNETIRDLLSPDQTDLRIHEDRKRGVFVSPLKEEIVTSPKQVMRIIRKGEENRHFGATDYNEHSSRSHTIFQMIVESRQRTGGSGILGTPNGRNGSRTPRGTVTMSQLNLIDLAGSEKATTDTDRRKEGAYINKSLLTLGTVISKLTDEKNASNSGGAGVHIPYRDSKLTRILQSSLAGNAKISVICTISPTIANAEESTNTLKFAARVKKVVIKASANRIVDEKALLQKYKAEIEELRNRLIATEGLLERERQERLANSGGGGSSLNVNGVVDDRERRKWEEQLADSRVQRTALKERIDHLTNMILTSKTITPKQLLDWTPEPGRNSVMMEGGLLPTSSTTSQGGGGSPGQMPRKSIAGSRLTDKEFMKRHIREIDMRDERIRAFETLVDQLRQLGVADVMAKISEFERNDGRIAGVDVVGMEKRNGELEEEVRMLRETVKMYEMRMVREAETRAMRDDGHDEELERERDRVVDQQRRRIEELENESKSLRGTVKSLRDSIRMLELTNDMFVKINASDIQQIQNEMTTTTSLMGTSTPRVSVTSASSDTTSDKRVRDLELALDRERRLRVEEQRSGSERVAGLEAELAIAKAELGVVRMVPVFGKSGR